MIVVMLVMRVMIVIVTMMMTIVMISDGSPVAYRYFLFSSFSRVLVFCRL